VLEKRLACRGIVATEERKKENRGMSRNRVVQGKIKLEIITENEWWWLWLRHTHFAGEILQLCTLHSLKLSSKCSSMGSFLPTTR